MVKKEQNGKSEVGATHRGEEEGNGDVLKHFAATTLINKVPSDLSPGAAGAGAGVVGRGGGGGEIVEKW
jgi:hypothetical protein